MARQAGAEATASTRINSEMKLTERWSITFYLLRGPTFQNRRPERNSLAAPNRRSALMQLKIERNGRDHIHRPARVRKRPDPPLPDRRNRGVRQRRRPAKDLVHFDATVFCRAHLQPHNSLHPGALRN